jgi:hypothetical protein
MRERLAVTAGIAALTLLGFFQFPGHTFLQSDTQIYVPMFEHILDSSVLRQDLMATRPHLSYTLYDEISIALRLLTGASFEIVLILQQLVFRTMQILGVYLLARSFPLSRAMALVTAAAFSLGATIVGPAVLTFEYEPVPRGFAVGLVFLAIGLAAQGHMLAADIAAAAAFLYHPPTVVPFWLLYVALTLRHRDYRALWPLLVSVTVLFIAAFLQVDVTEPQPLFSEIPAEQEQLQRMRASYGWVSMWVNPLMWQYVFLWILSLVAYWRVRPKTARSFLIGLPVIGLLSVPCSYLFLEKLKWSLIPQFQPARALLFVTAFAVILAAAAGIRAAEHNQWLESLAWFALVFAPPLQPRFSTIGRRQLVVLLLVSCTMTLSLYLRRFRWWPAPVLAAALAPFLLLPGIGRVQNYPRLETPGLTDLARFARDNTSKDAVFLFGDAGRGLPPGIFRARSERAVYVDWKSGGQVNYYKSLGDEWWRRWNAAYALQSPRQVAERLPALGIDYLVLGSSLRLEREPIYQNREFVVYEVPRGAR